MTSRPPQITDSHLRRRAVVYIRQSSAEQVRFATGSAAVQRDLAEKLVRWGFAPAMIEVLDGDLGISGARPGARDGFNGLVDRMEADEIGLVAVLDASRLSRNLHDFARFVEVARRHGVLLAQGDQIIDWDDGNAAFLGGVFGLLAIRENQVRAQLSVQARWKKVRDGKAPTAPPIGYVRRQDGSWEKDPDPRVREIITLIFDKVMELGSIRAVVRHFRTHGIQVPRRRRLEQKRWRDATATNIVGFVKNPVYAGRYIFGRTRQEPPEAGSRKRGRQRRQPITEWGVIDQHHAPYIDPARWEDVQRRIAANRRPVRPHLGRGQALVQGLLRCRVHGSAFCTVYSDRLKGPDGQIERVPRYTCCPGRYSGDSRTHASLVAAWVDTAIERLLLETLTPLALNGVREAVRQELRQCESLERGRRDEVRRAEQVAAEAERAYVEAEAGYGHLKKRLGERFEAALRELDHLRTCHRLQPIVPPLLPDDATLEELRQLLSDLPRLWRHPTVSHAQRKAIARAVIKVIHATPSPDAWTLDVEWVGGATTTVELTRAERRPTHWVKRRTYWPIARATYRMIWDQVARGIPRRVIAEALNAAGVRHHRGSWTTARVNSAAHRLRHGKLPGMEPPPCPPTVTDHVRALYAQGLSPADMVRQIRSLGTKTRHNTIVTEATVMAALKRLGLRTHSRLMDEKVCAYLQEWGKTARLPEVAARLNGLGLTTMQGGPWTPGNVREKLRDLGIAFVRQRRGGGKRKVEPTHACTPAHAETRRVDQLTQRAEGNAGSEQLDGAKALGAEERA